MSEKRTSETATRFINVTDAKLGVNEFARRHTPASKYSHYYLGVDEVIRLVKERALDAMESPDRKGVLLVKVPATGFYSGVAQVTQETQLRAIFASRRPEEELFIQIEAIGGAKLEAKNVVLVFYRRELLGNDASTVDADWELVSINARPTEGPEPLTPMTMARNQLGLPGGTAAMYTSEQWAESVRYWSTRAMIAG